MNPVELKTAVKQLNQICKGLGTAMEKSLPSERKTGRKRLSAWVLSVKWDKAPEGAYEWAYMYNLIKEMFND